MNARLEKASARDSLRLADIQGDGDSEGGAFADLAFDGYSTAEQLGEFLGDVKSRTEAAAKAGFGIVQLVEFVKNRIEFVRGNAAPGIACLDFQPWVDAVLTVTLVVEERQIGRARDGLHRHGDVVVVGELDGVADRVLHDLAQLAAVGDDWQLKSLAPARGSRELPTFQWRGYAV